MATIDENENTQGFEATPEEIQKFLLGAPETVAVDPDVVTVNGGSAYQAVMSPEAFARFVHQTHHLDADCPMPVSAAVGETVGAETEDGDNA